MAQKLVKPLLIVDESAEMRTLFASIVTSTGLADVITAPSIAAAQQAMQSTEPAALLTDFRLRGEDGLMLVEWLRRAPDSPSVETPAIVLTGRAAPDVISRARDAGAHAVVAKPVSMRTLLAKIQDALTDPRPFVRAMSYVGPCRRLRPEDLTPARRLVDDMRVSHLADDPVGATLASRVAALATLVRTLSPTSRSQIRALRENAEAIADGAVAIDDPALATAARSLVRYVDGCGLSGRLDTEIADWHAAALRGLAVPGRRRGGQERAVVAGLERIVARRMEPRAA